MIIPQAPPLPDAGKSIAYYQPKIVMRFNPLLILPILLGPANAAILSVSNFSLTPDGTTTSPIQTYDVNTNNGGTIVKGADPVAYFITTINFGTGTLADVQLNFAASAGQDRLGIKISDNGYAHSTGDGSDTSNDFDFNGGDSNPAGFMGGQTVTVLVKIQYDSTYSATYGESNASNDAFATVWINPTGSSLEGSGLPDGYGSVSNTNFKGDYSSILWNSSDYHLFEQRIFNNSTPGTAGATSITNTTILTGSDATWSNAIALATAVPEPSSVVLGLLGALLLLRRKRSS